MRLAFPLAALLAAAVSRDRCGDFRPYDPCEGKACGDACQVCPPGDPDCAETAVLKACDPWGRCVPETVPFPCEVPDPCAGKACGDACTISLPCHLEDPPCDAPQGVGHCDIAGACLPGDVGSCEPHPDCVGKACGDPCNPCGPERTCPTFMESACDPYGRCVGAVPWLCGAP